MEILSMIMGVVSVVILVFGIIPALIGTKLMGKKNYKKEGVKNTIIYWLPPIGMMVILALLPVLLLSGSVIFVLMFI